MSSAKGRRIRFAALILLNALLVSAVAALFVTYLGDYQQKLYEQNLSDITSINNSAANISSEFFKSQETKLRDILRYLERRKLDLDALLVYLDDTNSDPNVTYQLIGRDYAGFVARRGADGAFPPIDYARPDYAELTRVFDGADGGSDVSLSAEFTSQDTGSRSFARYIYVPAAGEDGATVYYTLMAVSRSSLFIDLINSGGGYDGLSTVLINEDGGYILRNSEFKTENFYKFLYSYNELSLDEMNAVRGEVAASGSGSLRYLDGESRECVFVYGEVPGESWFSVSRVPLASFRTVSIDITFTVLMIALFASMLLSDVLYLMGLNKRLKASANEARAANSAKTDFLSRMSHDIRTPINVINGMTELALQEPNPVRTDEYLGNIASSGKFLLGLVNDILDMNKVESGMMELRAKPYGYSEFKTYVNAVIAPLCSAKNVAFSVACNAEDTVLVVDGLRVNQIFFNLLSNSVKFTPSGGHIALNVRFTPSESGKTLFEAEVRDDGIGMSREFQQKMFESFTQENSARNDSAPGTGLGLAIVRSLVELMHGTMRVESDEGRGTAFFLSFEAERAEPSPNGAGGDTGGADLTGRRVLLCEDNPMNSLIIVKLLAKRSVSVDAAPDGKAGVERFAASADGYYDAVLMDIRMPVMDGIEAARTIRALPNRADASRVPIIALTANAYDSDVRECLGAGMDAHLAKPIDSSELFAALAKFIEIKGRGR